MTLLGVWVSGSKTQDWFDEMKRPLKNWLLLGGVIWTAIPAHAEPQSAEDFQWTFQSACLHSQPALIERGAEDAANSLGLDRLEASDVDAFWMGDNGMMMIVDGNPLSTKCVLAVSQSEITDDVAALTRLISERISDHAGDAEVTVTYDENVPTWEWTKSDVSFSTGLETRDGQYTITLEAAR